MSTGPVPSIPPLRPIRFGVLCEGPTIPAWQARSIEELKRVPGVSLGLRIVPEESLAGGSRPRRWPEDPFLVRAYLRLRPSRAQRPVGVDDVFRPIPTLTCHTTTGDGSSQTFEEFDLRRIKG